MTVKKSPVFLLLFLLLHSCASFQEYIDKEERDWSSRQPDPGLAITHTMFLVGDAGNAAPGETPSALELLGRQLKAAGKNSSVVYLGDNIYPDGLAPKLAKEERSADEYRLQAQLDILKDYPGRVFFIPGNHDWYGYGVDGLKREKKFIEKYLDRDDVWEPDCGCGGPEEVELGENLVLVLVDSHWFLTDWDGEPEINDGCEVKSRAMFKRAFEEAIKGNRNKNVVVAVHHPPYSNGSHGGKFTAKEHLFPLTALQKDLYVPLPVLGSFFAFLRGATGSKQDISHPLYREMRDAMITSARKNGNFIFASGHEHSLQYIERDDQSFIVSGSGSKKTATGKGEGLKYGYGQHGFVQLDFYEDGSAWAHYWVAEGEGRVAFRKQVKGPLPALKDEGAYDYTIYESGQDTVVRELIQQDFNRSGLGEAVWGEHYRKVYDTELPVPVMDLKTFKGGVVPVKQGGGYQTNSLRLEDEEGRQYSMRSVEKDATRILTYPLNESFALGIVQDVFTSSHPLSALPIPALAKAVGVYYSNPRLYFVPRQPQLGKYNESFGNDLYLIEERADDDVWGDYENFGNSSDIISTPDMIEEIHDGHDHLVDQSFVLRNRLFDLLLGDWDRHDDQWRWATIKKGDRKYYRPIPRDRDQAFSKYDGLVLDLFGNVSPASRPFQPYRPDVKRVQWVNFGSRHFDNSFYPEMEWSDWEKNAREIQAALTDEVIENAFREAWPEEIYDLNGPEIIGIMKKRRDNLVNLARRLYLFRARKVDVVGTNKKDLFEVERLPEGNVRVQVFDTNKDGEKEENLFDRLFILGETKEIVLYGLDDEDIFYFRGKSADGIRVRAVGGLGDDIFIDESEVKGSDKKNLLYDVTQENNKVTYSGETSIRFSDNPVFNTYNRKAPHYDYNWGIIFPSVSFNPDDGLLVGFFGSRTYYGFMKNPYASTHKFSASLALETLGWAADYEGEFVDAIGKMEIGLAARAQSERYSINFYGFGNETRNPEDSLGLEYNRVRQGLYSIYPSLMRRLNKSSTWSIGPTFEAFQIEETEGRIVTEIFGEESREVFEGQQFAGIRTVLNYRNQNDVAFPTRGIAFWLDLGWKQQLQDEEKNFAFLNTDFTIYQNLDQAGRLVLATRLGLRHIFNEVGFEFYQGATLGGIGPRSNFRGFRRDRFTGQTAFFQNIDLRWRLFTSTNKVLPFSMGVLAGFDHGRVWYEGEDSDIWHYSYGGGVFFTPLDMLALHFSLFRGDDEFNRFTFGGRFFF